MARATKLTLRELRELLLGFGADVPLPSLRALYAPIVAENARLNGQQQQQQQQQQQGEGEDELEEEEEGEQGQLPGGITFSQLVSATRARFEPDAGAAAGAGSAAAAQKQAKQYFRGNHLGCRAQGIAPSPAAEPAAAVAVALPLPGAKPPLGTLRGAFASSNMLAHDMSAAAHAHELPEACTLHNVKRLRRPPNRAPDPSGAMEPPGVRAHGRPQYAQPERVRSSAHGRGAAMGARELGASAAGSAAAAAAAAAAALAPGATSSSAALAGSAPLPLLPLQPLPAPVVSPRVPSQLNDAMLWQAHWTDKTVENAHRPRRHHGMGGHGIPRQHRAQRDRDGVGALLLQ